MWHVSVGRRAVSLGVLACLRADVRVGMVVQRYRRRAKRHDHLESMPPLRREARDWGRPGADAVGVDVVAGGVAAVHRRAARPRCPDFVVCP